MIRLAIVKTKLPIKIIDGINSKTIQINGGENVRLAMQRQRMKVLMIVVVLSLLTSVGTYAKGAAATTLSVFSINLNQPPSTGPNDVPVGMECGDPQFVYVSILSQGLLAKIDKNTHSTQLIATPDAPVNDKSFSTITRDPNTGNLFINDEGSKGTVWRFEPSSSTWTRITVVEREPMNDNIFYPFTYEKNPFDIVLLGDGDEFTFGAAANPPGGMVFANGFIWAGLAYTIDFGDDPDAFQQGAVNLIFNGVVKIDPKTSQVTRIQIPNALHPAGLAVDSTEPSIIWISDAGADKVYKFDTNSLQVVRTIDLNLDIPSGSRPNGIATDATHIFVALNTIGSQLGGVNDIIAQIDRQTLAVTPIDTGAQNSFLGTYVLVVNNGVLVWTDQNRQAGTIDLSTGQKTIDIVPGTVTGSTLSPFGCVPKDGEFWFTSVGSADVAILPNSKFSAGGPVPNSTGSDPCTGTVVINSTTAANAPKNIDYRSSGCVILDDEPPKIVRAFVTPGDWVCVEAHDNVRTMNVTFNDRAVPPWPGSPEHFCTNEELPPIIEVVAIDAAGNKSKMVAINVQQIVTTGTEQTFSAVVSKELNPHKDIEGMVLMSKEPIKQIRIAASPEFADQRFLRLSDIAMQELNGQHTIVVKYYGQHVDRKGQLYVFAVNRGLLATFDVAVDGNDMKLSLHQEKALYQPYDLKLDNTNVIDNMRLNAWQKAEFENALQNDDGKLTLTQTNVLSMVLRLASTSH